jgi:hypothetical protein
MKLIFFFCKNNFRKNAFGNFSKTNIIGKYFIINCTGRIRFFILYLLKFLKYKRIISVDGNPLIAENFGINFWLSGTHLKIPTKFASMKNNFVNITNPILSSNEKVFQIYPIVKKLWKLKKNPKIIYMGKFFFFHSDKKNKEHIYKSLVENYSEIDNKKFWQKNFPNLDEYFIFEEYKIFKNFIREDIVKNIDINFRKYFEIYVDGNPSISLNSKVRNSNYNTKKVRNIYNGNLCIDTGSIMGSISVYPRSIQILESSGFLLQNRQADSYDKWSYLEKDITFRSFQELNNLIEKYLSYPAFREEIYIRLKDLNKNNFMKIEKSLDDVFK